MKQYDLIIRNGTLYNGSGSQPFTGDVAVSEGRIRAVGTALPDRAVEEIDATGFDVTPGFINIQSWAARDLLADPRTVSDLSQGVTLEVFGEGWSEGPLTEPVRQHLKAMTGAPDIPWTSLREFLELLAGQGTAVNVASLVGAATLRYHVVGLSPDPCSPKQLDAICGMLEESLQEGALGLGTALVYEPEFLYTTEDLTAMARTTARYGGLYAAHIRNESRHILTAIDEHIRITRNSGVRSMIYHFKVQGKENWLLQEPAIAAVTLARASGLDISACAYPYAAGSTGLSAALNPAWKTEGTEAWIRHLRDPNTRRTILEEVGQPGEGWENFFRESGGGDGVLVTGIAAPGIHHLQGRYLSEIAADWGVSSEEALLDLIVRNGDDVQAIFFHTSEDNLTRVLEQPWVSIGSDSGSTSPGSSEGQLPHPRAFGSFAKLFRKYVFEMQLFSPEEAVRRITALPASQLGLETQRGRLSPGLAADIVICRLSELQDHANYRDPLRLSTGIRDVLVNGIPALRNGSPTGALPGKVVTRR